MHQTDYLVTWSHAHVANPVTQGRRRLPQAGTKAIMSTLTIELPDSLKKNIEALAAREGYTVSQFLASAAGEKLAVVMTMDYLRREAASGRRADFEKYLAAVPDA